MYIEKGFLSTNILVYENQVKTIGLRAHIILSDSKSITLLQILTLFSAQKKSQVDFSVIVCLQLNPIYTKVSRNGNRKGKGVAQSLEKE